MAVFNGAFPILPGKEQQGRDFAVACMGERRKGFEALQNDIESDAGDLGPAGDSDGKLHAGVVRGS